MADDLDSMRLIHGAMAMMKMEPFCVPRFHHFDVTTQLPIVISGDNDRLAVRRQIFQKARRFRGSSLIMHEIAQDNQMLRFIFLDQLQQTLRDRRHSPHRHETAGGALAQLVTEMKIGDRQPTLLLVEKREAPIEQNFRGDERLVRA